MPVILPTVGRVVLFKPDPHDANLYPDESGRCAAIVTYVHSPEMVNLAVFAGDGRLHPKTSVPLVQEDPLTDSGYYCHWMPYQIQKAASET